MTGVLVDGVVLDPARYQAASGSTVLTLPADTLKTLAVGQHTLRLQYADGYAQTTFSVRPLPADVQGNGPQTGDAGSLALWSLLLAAGGLALSLARRSHRRSA